ncbi:MAG: DUF3276 family protein [Candidatus Bathyarchaeia archaeon]
MGSEPNHNEFLTIDDAIEKAQELANMLSELGELRHPLDIRKGVENMEDKSERSKTLKAGSKTYFFDIKETKEGKPFLVITESRFKGDGEERERSAIIAFSGECEGIFEHCLRNGQKTWLAYKLPRNISARSRFVLVKFFYTCWNTCWYACWLAPNR